LDSKHFALKRLALVGWQEKKPWLKFLPGLLAGWVN